MSGALFEVAESPSTVYATELARGPWDPRHCHGGPVAALLARAVELADSGGPEPAPTWQVARMTVELVRPVPVQQPLTLATRVERPGRKVSLVAVELSDDTGSLVAVARSLRIRSSSVPLPDDPLVRPEPPFSEPGEGATITSSWSGDTVAFHRDACEHRFAEGSWDLPGPVEVWIRLLVPVVEGETPSGVQRVVAAADFGNGVSGALPFERYLFINPDLTVHLQRPPHGEWVGMRTRSHYGELGAGLAESALFDERGRVGRAVQSLLIESR